MASTEDTAATGAAAAAANTVGGMHSMYAQAVEQYEANVAAASEAGTDGGGQVSGKPSNSAAPDAKKTGEPKKSKPRGHVPWNLFKELPSPEGGGNPWNRTDGAQPSPTTQLEKTCLAKESNPIFPIGFYTLSNSKRGVTRGRGQWRGKEMLCLLHCAAEKNGGCPFKARFARTANGIEIWTSGEHAVYTHKFQPKRGLNSEARAFVTKNHDLSQGQLLDLLLQNGLIPSDCTTDELLKIKAQIKRRRSTVKNQISKEKLVVASMRAPMVEKERAMEAANRNAVGVIVAAGGLVRAREEQERIMSVQMVADEALGHSHVPQGPPPLGPPPPAGVLRQMMMDPEAAAAAAAAAEAAVQVVEAPLYPALPHHI